MIKSSFSQMLNQISQVNCVVDIARPLTSVLGVWYLSPRHVSCQRVYHRELGSRVVLLSLRNRLLSSGKTLFRVGSGLASASAIPLNTTGLRFGNSAIRRRSPPMAFTAFRNVDSKRSLRLNPRNTFLSNPQRLCYPHLGNFSRTPQLS